MSIFKTLKITRFSHFSTFLLNIIKTKLIITYVYQPAEFLQHPKNSFHLHYVKPAKYHQI